MDTFTELHQLADDLTELGDNATAALVCQAIDRFSAWKFEAGEELLERSAGGTAQARTRLPSHRTLILVPWRLRLRWLRLRATGLSRTPQPTLAKSDSGSRARERNGG